MKKILYALVFGAVFLLFLVSLGFFFSGKMDVSVRRIINKPPHVIFRVLSDLQRFVMWSPWSDLDPDTAYRYGGGVGVGSYMEWSSTSQRVGKGRLTIVEVVEDSAVHEALFFGDAEQPSHVSLLLEPVPSGTEVTWTLTGDLGWNPVARWMNFLFIERGVKASYQKGLENLERMVAGQSDHLSSIASSIQEASYFLGIQGQGDSNQVRRDFSAFYQQLYDYVRAKGVSLKEDPRAVLYFSHQARAMEYLVALRTENKEISHGKEGIVAYVMPAGHYLVATHAGACDTLSESHEMIMQHIQREGLQVAGPVREDYLVSPRDVDATSTCQTVIYYPVAAPE